ncbi:MAG TPA: tetratricopeptide repeat protein, partial [Bdellovibrionota bacterium]|nr:tetratricopeptide repeat protein [Bdellovibrionota bacterium]
TFTKHSRLSMRLDEGVNAQFSSDKTGFTLFLEGASLLDLGAPLGEEKRWASQFSALKDPRVGKLEFTEQAGGVKVTGAWNYPKGADALANPVMEHFEYRDKSGSRYVVDFWAKEGPTVAQAQVIKKKVQAESDLKAAEEAARRRTERRIASLKSRQEAEDVLRFCRQPSSESNDVFLPAYGEHEKVAFSKWVPATTPDANFTYFEPPRGQAAGSDPVHHVRLALSLYSQGKPALAIRTVDFLERDFPESKHLDEMRFLKANSMIKLGLHDEADRILGKLVTEAPASPAALHSALYLAVKQMERNQALAALESFLWLIQRHPDHRLAWVFHLGAAEALYSLKQTDRAAKEYQWVTENAPDRRSQAEGALRQGDLFLSRLQHDQALAAYFQALSRFGEEARTFPAVHLNRAETLYGLGQWERAEKAFRDVLEQHPSYSSGWLATLRLGEILSRRDEPEAREQGRKWLYETINRFPFSPAATIARLRLMPCGDHGGFDQASAEKFIANDARRFDGAGEFHMAPYGGLRALSRVRMLAAFGQEDKAVAAGLEELAEGLVLGESKNVLGRYLRVLFRKAVSELLIEGRKFEALALYDKQGRRIPTAGGEIMPGEMDYLLKLSQAASDLGLSQVALDLSESHRVAAKAADRRLSATAGEADPQDLEVRIQQAEQDFSEGKARWIAIADVRKAGPGAYAPVRALLARIPAEAPFSQEAFIILGLMDEREGKLPSALAHGTKAQLLTTRDPRLLAWMASLQARAGDPRVALEMYRNLENHLALEGKPADAKPAESSGVPALTDVLGVPPSPTRIEAILAQAEQQEKMARWGDAALTYERAMESGKGGGQAQYGYARALLNGGAAGDRGKALELLEKLASDAGTADKVSKDPFWAKLARQKLEDEKRREPSSTGSMIEQGKKGAGGPAGP